MLHIGPHASSTSNDDVAREDFANHLLGLTTLAVCMARGDTQLEPLTASYLSPFMVALGVIPSFKEYLASGGGAQLAPTVEPTTVERMQEISLNLRTTIKELNDDPSNREHLACLLGLVSQVLPAHNASQQYLPEAIKQVRAGNGLSWSDVLDAVTK